MNETIDQADSSNTIPYNNLPAVKHRSNSWVRAGGAARPLLVHMVVATCLCDFGKRCDERQPGISFPESVQDRFYVLSIHFKLCSYTSLRTNECSDQHFLWFRSLGLWVATENRRLAAALQNGAYPRIYALKTASSSSLAGNMIETTHRRLGLRRSAPNVFNEWRVMPIFPNVILVPTWRRRASIGTLCSSALQLPFNVSMNRS